MTDNFDFEEIMIKCGVCGKESKIVVYKGYDTAGFVCQRCSLGDFGSEDDDSDV